MQSLRAEIAATTVVLTEARAETDALRKTLAHDTAALLQEWYDARRLVFFAPLFTIASRG